MINVSELNFKYNSYKETKVLDNISFDVGKGEIACLLGPSGCGKTSTLRLIAGLETPNSGSITIAGGSVADDRTFLEPHKRGIGFLFQDFALFPHLTVQQNIGWGLINLDKKDKVKRIKELLDQTSMVAHGDKYPHELSGGEQQRVSLARALAPRPTLLLLDEPFSSLDTNLRNDVRKETNQILRDTNTTAIIVTHDSEEAMLIADRIILMSEGKILQDGTPQELYNNPSNQFTAAFFGYVNRVDGVAVGGVIETILGQIPNQDFPDGENLDIIIRPQTISLSNATSESSKNDFATIDSVKFMGSDTYIWFNIEINKNKKKQILAIQAKKIDFVKGDKVKFDINTEGIFAFKRSC